MIDVQEVITDSRILGNRYILRNGFPFTAITYPANVYDAIAVKYPQDVPCFWFYSNYRNGLGKARESLAATR